MPPSASFEYHDLKPAAASFLEDVTAGLSARQKALPPKYFYDDRGSALFEAICNVPEYYPTRTELAILETHASEIAARIGASASIVEYGIGSGRKTAVLLRAVKPVAYVAIDISGEQLQASVAALATGFPDVRMIALCADYTRPLPLARIDNMAAPRVVYFPGSTIGNFTVPEALAFLRNARAVAGEQGAMLVGVDLKKDVALLHAAYNDAAGITASFNLNVLERINRELSGNIDIELFSHRAHYDEAAGRIEMHLVSSRDQIVTISGRPFEFRRGESIHTESSYKYSVAGFQALAREAGFNAQHYWVDECQLFSIHYLEVAAG